MRPEFAAEIDRFAAAPQYQIDLTIAPDLASYSATQVVTYTNAETEPLNEVYFSLFPNLASYGGRLEVQTVSVDGQTVQPVLEESGTALKIPLAQPLQPGESISIAMRYAGEVPTSDVESGYNQFGLHNNVLALPNFYPQIPAYDDHGWHIAAGPGYGDAVFSDTALYRVNLTAPADQVVATSGVCDRMDRETESVQQCGSGPMRDFMIAMSADYQVKSDSSEGTTINSYFMQEDEKAGVQALQTARQAMEVFSRRFGPYPFTELDLLETPTTAGGIEYPGLIVIASRAYARAGAQEGTTAHEMAHQWWYSLVGNDQVSDPWLDEALAQFSMCLYYRDTHGQVGLDSCVEQALRPRYEQVQGTDQDRRADLPVADYSPSEYGTLVYGKAALFFNAIYQEVGDEKFNQLLQDYFKQYRYGVAYPQDFFAIAAKYVGQDKLDELLKEWITTP
jgi:aminopeptidase N